MTLGRDRPCVILCQKGLKLSQGVAALRRAHGGNAAVLEGGALAWAQAQVPMIPMQTGLGQHRQNWVCPLDPTAGEVMAQWIIARFADPHARWLGVDRDQVAAIVHRFDAHSLDLADHIRKTPGLEQGFAKMSQSLGCQSWHGMVDGVTKAGHAPSALFGALDAVWANVAKGGR